MPGGGEVRGGRAEASAVGALPAAGIGVGGPVGPVDAGGEHDVGCVAVGTEPGGALAQQAAVAVGGVEEVVEEFSAYPLFGLAGRAAGEQQQGGDERGPLQGPLVDGVEVGPAVQDEGAEGLAAGGDGGDPVVALADGVALPAADRSGVRLGELDGAAEDFGDGVGHVVDAAAVQDEFGEPVVDLGGPLDDAAVLADDVVGPLQLREGRAGLGEEVGGVDGDGGVRGEGAEQRDLFAFEDPGPAVGGEEDADDLAAEAERHAEDGDEALVPHRRVDGAGVLEARVVEVVVGDVRAGGLGDEPAEPLAHAQPQLLEARGDGALGDPHVRVPGGLVVEAQIGDLGTEERAGALDDRAQHGVEVAESREVVGGREERGQLRLAAPPPLQLGPDAQGEQLGLFQLGQHLGARAARTGEQYGPVVCLRRGPSGEEFQVGDVFVGHGHRDTCRTCGRTTPVDDLRRGIRRGAPQ